MGRPEDADRPMGKPASLEMKAAAKQYEELTRKEKNAMRPGRSSGRLGKWCLWQAKAKRAPTDVLEAFWRMNPQPANAQEGHDFTPKMPSGPRFDLSRY